MCMNYSYVGNGPGVHILTPLTMTPQIRITTAPGVFIKNSVPRVMAHYGFTTEDIGSHPNALMSVKKFAHTSIRPYVGECVFDSLVNPISPIYGAIRNMCRDEARERYAARVGGVIEYTGGRTHVRWQ